MINGETLLPIDRFLATLSIVYKEGVHLQYSWQGLYANQIDEHWVQGLGQRPEQAEQMEAFVSRFGRMQDTIADKLLPRWLAAQAEQPGSQIEVLNRAARLGVVSDVEQWLAARALRNRMVHEYMEEPARFAADLMGAKEFTQMLFVTYNQIRESALQRLKMELEDLPPSLAG